MNGDYPTLVLVLIGAEIVCAWLGWRVSGGFQSVFRRRLLRTGVAAFFLAPSFLGFMPCPAFIVLVFGVFAALSDPGPAGGAWMLPLALVPIAVLWPIFLLIASVDSMIKERSSTPRLALWSGTAALFFAFSSQGCAVMNVYQTLDQMRSNGGMYANPKKFLIENGIMPIVYWWLFLFLLSISVRKLIKTVRAKPHPLPLDI